MLVGGMIPISTDRAQSEGMGRIVRWLLVLWVTLCAASASGQTTYYAYTSGTNAQNIDSKNTMSWTITVAPAP